MQLFFSEVNFESIKEEFKIEYKDLKILLISYRYFLNDIFSQLDTNKSNIYQKLYNISYTNFDSINSLYFPGNDIKEKDIYNLLSKIEDHFSGDDAKRACYICYCNKKGYFHNDHLLEENKKVIKCKECGHILWQNESYIPFLIRLKPVKSDIYFRIFKDEKEKEEEHNKDFLYNFQDRINCITKEEFINKFAKNEFDSEKGITKVKLEHLKRNNKVVRNLSQVSYRLLNFILYSHIFFARLFTDNKKLDDFLPEGQKGKITWMEMLTNCWELLKNELSKYNINNTELFMNYIFCGLFEIMKGKKEIRNYEYLIELEDLLEKYISEKIKIFSEENKTFQKLIKPNKNDKLLPINLLKELYDEDGCDEYPLYKYFYFTHYLNEDVLQKKFEQSIDNIKYPVLAKYLRDRKNQNNNLNKLSLYNSVLNLFREKYFLNKTREEAEKEILNDNELYLYNSENIDKFIKFYNSLEKSSKEGKKLKLSKKSKLSDFFIDEENDIGKSYINIYYDFIEKQNGEIAPLLQIKIDEEKLDESYKHEVNIQNIKDNEIFSFKLNKNFSIVNIIFNNSFRKVLINNIRNHESFNNYEIDWEQIEDNMTDILLKNKKLFNKNITKFIYKNEDLFFDNIDIITKFNSNYPPEELLIKEKLLLYELYKDNKENQDLINKILEDFKNLIIHLNNIKNNANNKIKDKSIIYDCSLLLKENISDKFKDLFKGSDIAINKLSNLFEYYLILAYPVLSKELIGIKVELPEDKIDEIENYFKKNHLINKDIFAFSIRLFISSFLSGEKDKENKIKKNANNIVNYIDIPDIWKKGIYIINEFREELNSIKNLKIQLNQIYSLSELIGGDIDNNYFIDIQRELKRREDEKKEKNEQGEEKYEEKKEQNEEEEEEEVEDDDYKKSEDDDDSDDYGGKF